MSAAVNLAAYIEAATVDGEERSFTIELGEGEAPIKVPGPHLWSDAVLEAVTPHPVKAAKLLLGEAEYARFAKAGGTATILWRIVRERNQASAGESKPSAAS